MFASVFGGHYAVVDRLEFNIGGVRNGSSDNLAGTGVFEPTAVRVVAPQVRVERVVHGIDIAFTRNFAGGDDLRE